MARPLRLEYPGALYHVTSRGNAGQKIFRKGGRDGHKNINIPGGVEGHKEVKTLPLFLCFI